MKKNNSCLNVRLLGINLGNLGKTWKFDIGEPIINEIIPEKQFKFKFL